MWPVLRPGEEILYINNNYQHVYTRDITHGLRLDRGDRVMKQIK